VNPERLDRLLRLRRIEESEATRQLAQRLRQLDAMTQQREQLQHYQQEYWQTALREQLAVALEQQELRIQAAESQVATAREEWLQRHRACLSLEKLSDRRRAEGMQREARRQQIEQDLWATRQVHVRGVGRNWQDS
jgi:flagellar FliJ protein